MSKGKVALFVTCCIAAGAAQAQGSFTKSREVKVDPTTWVAQQPLAAPTLPDGLPAGSAGCVVVGHHLDASGTTSKPRVMQGAFTKDVSSDAQKAFIAQALSASARWRFRSEPPKDVPAILQREFRNLPAPTWGFERVVVGFAASSPDARPNVVFDADKQDARVVGQCGLEPLAEWGKRNAVSVEVAKARSGDAVLSARLQEQAYWVTDGETLSPRFPRKPGAVASDGCVVVGYMIGVDGIPSDFRVMRSTGAATPPVRKAFEDAALGAAATWRYAPGPDNLKRLPEFRQTPVRFNSGRFRRESECEAVDLATGK